MKTMLNLYIEAETKAQAQSQGINLSKSFEEFLNILLSKDYKGENKDSIINSLKAKLTAISIELTAKTAECERLKNKSKLKLMPMPRF